MRLRSVLPLFLVAAFMVVWLSVRFWCGDWHGVWVFSCLLGAWAPIFAAGVFLYVLSVAAKHDHVAVAWVVRALGMHFVLVWMLGSSDWLRGPPGAPPAFNPDVFAPLVLLGFFPPFAVGVGMLKWFRSLERRLTDPLVRPAMPRESSAGPAPFRGVPLVSAGAPLAPAPVAPFAVGALALFAARALPAGSWWILAASALALALAALRNHRALLPGALAQVVVTAAVVARPGLADTHALVAHGFVWPWASVLGVGLYFGAVESALRARRPAVRTI